MKPKAAAPSDYRMSASDFDGMMRGARFDPPPSSSKKAPAKKLSNPKARKKKTAA